jgi:hypothetical protein
MFVTLGICFAAGGIAGCGDDVVCPTGTGGSPCRYTVGPGSPPTLLPAPDAVDAIDDVIELDVSSTEDAGEDIVPETTGNGDVEGLDAAETNEGQDTEPNDDADEGDIDAEPSDARADMAGSETAHDETPDDLLAGGSVRAGDPHGSARLARPTERSTEDIDARFREPAPGCGTREREPSHAHS